MSSGDRRERIVAEVPAELKDLVDADERPIREVVEAALWREFGGERKSSLERRIEEKEQRISMIQSERNERNRELDEQKDALDALRQKLDAVKSTTEKYQSGLDNVLDIMTDTGMHVDPGHGKVTDLAAESGKDPETVIEDLKERAEERDVGLPDRRFERRVGFDE